MSGKAVWLAIAGDVAMSKPQVLRLLLRDEVKVAAEFRGSEQLGLPSATDRDKFIALLKILSEERVGTGQIANAIRFSSW